MGRVYGLFNAVGRSNREQREHTPVMIGLTVSVAAIGRTVGDGVLLSGCHEATMLGVGRIWLGQGESAGRL